jgi:uncharacterized integral membrane protein (TIGR00697 family)
MNPESIAPDLHEKRERVFLILAGIFLGTLAMLNILGITRFLDFSFELFGTQIPFQVAVGVLPYPITFLCTDLISELYGKARANFVVWMGLGLNIWVMFILWLGGTLPGTDAPAFFEVRRLAFGAVTASMIAYLAAQFCDVHLYHFWKNLTKGKHLWLRNNASTVVSQLVDTVAVICITWYLGALPPPEAGQTTFDHLMFFIISGYVFKVTVALLDTGPFYLCVSFLNKYLKFEPQEYNEDSTASEQ